MVTHITFDFVGLGYEMAEVCEDALKRIRNFCPRACIEVRAIAGSQLSRIWTDHRLASELDVAAKVKRLQHEQAQDSVGPQRTASQINFSFHTLTASQAANFDFGSDDWSNIFDPGAEDS